MGENGNGPKGLFLAALRKAKTEFKPLVKNKTNPHFNSSYADLAALHEAIDEALEANGFLVTQPLGYDVKDRYGISTTLAHSGGYEVISFYPVSTELEPQKRAAAITYGRRNSLSSLLAIPADDDDDGNAAQPPPGGLLHGPGVAKPIKKYNLPPKEEVQKPPAEPKEPLVVPDHDQTAPAKPKKEGVEEELVEVLTWAKDPLTGGTGNKKWWKIGVKVRWQNGQEGWVNCWSERLFELMKACKGATVNLHYKRGEYNGKPQITVEDIA